MIIIIIIIIIIINIIIKIIIIIIIIFTMSFLICDTPEFSIVYIYYLYANIYSSLFYNFLSNSSII